MQRSLQQWSCDVFGSIRGELKKLRKELEEVCKKSWHRGISREENDLLKKILELLVREETMMRQRSRVQWLIEGDRNTYFFHDRSRDLARQNKIKTLKKEARTVCHKQTDLENAAIDFYNKLFSAQEDLNPNEVI
jgi:hypothetical protein